MTDRDAEDRLARVAHEALRQLPPQHAPASLEARTLAEIERRAALPRWRAGIARWPAAARWLLIAVCGVCVPLAWWLGPRLWARSATLLAGSGAAQHLSAVSQTGNSLLSLAQLATHLLRLIPTEWLLGGLLAAVTVYGVLAAVGYLLLYPSLSHSGTHSA